MAEALNSQVSFSGGVVSPKLSGRVDQQKYRSALRQCLNMIPYKTGPLTRRPGTEYIAACKLQNFGGNQFAARLMKFIFSPQTTFILEFGNFYIRFYSNGEQVTISSAPIWVSGKAYKKGAFVEDPGATPANAIYYCIADVTSATQPHSDPTHWLAQTIYEVPSPYSADAPSGTQIWDTDVWTVVPCQINDVVYLVHPDYPPYKLSRFGDTDWTMEEVNFLTPALLDQNATDTTLVPSATTGDNITLIANAPPWVTANYYSIGNSVKQNDIIYKCLKAHVSGTFATDLAAGDWETVSIFNPGHVGSTWQLANLRAAAYVEYDGTAAGGFTPGTSDTIQVQGSWEMHSYGTWSADVALQRSLDGGMTWDTVSSFTGRFDRNADIKGTALQLGLYQIVVSNVAAPATPGASDPRIVFECVDAFLYGLVKITSVPINAAAGLPTGYVGQINTLGTTNWAAIGAGADFAVGTIFKYNGTAVTGTGGTVFSPYQVNGDVVTELYQVTSADLWVSGSDYVVGDFVTSPIDSKIYLCTTALMNSTTDPSLDSGHWEQTQIPPTEYWSEGAWSDYRGYPQAVASFQQRVIYAASGYEPQRIWGSVTNDIENFARGDQTLATDSFAFDLNAPMRGPINWLIAQTDLFCGFSGAEWVVNSGSTNNSGISSGAAITPTNINAVEHSAWGNAYGVSPYIVGDAVIYCQRQAIALRQMLFSVYTEKYMSQDITALADHLFTSGIVQIDYQPQFRNQGMVWCVTRQGSLNSLTYELEQEVFGWAQHKTGNVGQTFRDPGFESVAVIDGKGQVDDEVWVVVSRTSGSGGQIKRYVERMNPNNWETVFVAAPDDPGPVLSQAIYVDSATTFTAPGSVTLTGLDHLEGRNVIGLIDGANMAPQTVVSGSITIPNLTTPPAIATIGLPIGYTGQPMRLDSDPRAGNTQGLVKQVSDMYVRVWNSNGGNVWNGSPASQQVPIKYRLTAEPLGAPMLVTEPTDIRVQPMLNPSPDTDPILIVTGQDALPLTVISWALKYTATATA